jgi:hypothetical protein
MSKALAGVRSRKEAKVGSRDSRVDAYIVKAAPFARPILRHLRKVVHAGCPDVEETMKWSFPHFMYKGILCSMASFTAHCAFGFWKGALLEGTAAVKREGAMGQFGRITAVTDLPAEKALIGMVREAVALNDRGVKAPRRAKSAPRAAPEVPSDVIKALKASKAALAAWERLSPSHRREYLQWITEARTEATRKRRLGTALEWIEKGKSRNWKYERA